ncbi:hypothetical protein [Agreia sp. Leaf283]|uniref:hypothetical protein n=1 Tax=Agreia sp. Leaf283 TaxID=1736321 RepID=UPI0006F91EBA|nr:hypothetical protein [Agreia sp. Leaf283]KQP57790.1 hypothetical protein ASF51_08355 [Agreia sp. Leaf283]
MPEPYTYSFTCHDAEFKAYEFVDYRAAWDSPTPLVGCDGVQAGGSFYSDTQKAASAAAGQKDLSSLVYLYGTCASLHTSVYGSLPSYSANQVAELTGVFMLCPDQPGAAAVQAKLGVAVALDAERESGNRFGAGIRRVGVDIQPGTFVSEGNITNCYWERLDSAGNIIDNNFLTQALRVEVVLEAGDFSFSSDGCGEWVRVG